jgi:hypothetical protein
MLNKPDTKKIGECEVCPAIDIEITVHYGNLWMCDSCWQKEQQLKSEVMKPENIEARINSTRINPTTPIDSQVIQTSKAIDSSITVRTDLFNAATVAIMDIKKAIDSDESITNKPAKLAETLLERFNHYKQVVFELNEKIVEAGTEQKAIQVYLNQLANSLRAEEREKYKISDINYKPNAPKSPIVRSISTTGTKKKIDKALAKKYSMELGINEFTFHSFALQMNGDVDAAYKKIKASIEAAKSKS